MKSPQLRERDARWIGGAGEPSGRATSMNGALFLLLLSFSSYRHRGLNQSFTKAIGIAIAYHSSIRQYTDKRGEKTDDRLRELDSTPL